ncbi:hypothetical protein [Paenibacillus larvae]|uniref:hypothetical protein n=1 Tax=Paenibacillus larvae TaxID=1464 RepID=UPI00227E83F2|nr:hypothetical protein [Paenibacillus larvae]MCY9572720.1 hypothetical protein [Paenibacillus larvae]
MKLKKNITRGIVALTALTILTTSGFGSISSAQAAEKTSISKTQTPSVPTNFNQKPTVLKYSQASTQYVFNSAKSGKIQPRGPIFGALRAIKFIGSICRVGGKSLQWILKPLSPEKAKVISKYADKIADATERLNTASKGALVSALIAVGVPEKTAEALADIILWLI